MSKKIKVGYELDSSGIKNLIVEEIKAILRAADELIAVGGRSMLAKILKGSKDKKLLEYKLDECPVYGFYRNFTLQEFTKVHPINSFTWDKFDDTIFMKLDNGNLETLFSYLKLSSFGGSFK